MTIGTVRVVALAFGLIVGGTLTGAVIMIGIFIGSGCEDEVVAANASAYEAAAAAGNLTSSEVIFDEEAFVCLTAQSSLETASWVEVICITLTAIITTAIGFRVSSRRGYFAEHGFKLQAYTHDVIGDKFVRNATASMFSLHFFAVGMRSFLNNTRELVTAVVATRMVPRALANRNCSWAVCQRCEAAPH